MASRREYELLLSLKAALGSSFNSTFTTATKTMKTLNDKLKEISKTQSNVAGYEKTQKALS